MGKSLMERFNRARIHKIKVGIEYEGTPIDEDKKELMTRMFADGLVAVLRDRDDGNSDATYTLGLSQELDINGGET